MERLFELLQQQSMQNNEGVSVITRQMDGMECDVQTNEAAAIKHSGSCLRFSCASVMRWWINRGGGSRKTLWLPVENAKTDHKDV